MGRHRKVKYSLVFNRKGELNRFGEALIQIRAYQNPNNRYFSTGIYIEPKYWDKRNRKVKHNHPNQFVYNQRIIQQLQEMEQFEIKMINKYGSFPLERIGEYQEAQKQDVYKSFTAFFAQEIEISGLKYGSLKMYRQTLNKLQDFRETIYFEDIDFNLIQKFDRFLYKSGLGINTIKKHHDRVKALINAAIKVELLPPEGNPYKRFRPRKVEPERIVLSIEELKAIENLEVNEQHLERVKDMFLFCCYTGLRFYDISCLSFDKLAQSEKGLIIELKAQKTEKRLRLPLYDLFRDRNQVTSRPEAIIWKYHQQLSAIGDPWQMKNFHFFDVTNQYFNRALKELAQLAKVNKKLTSHVARRTFATIMATKVKAPVLQKLLQHSRPDMTNIYIQLSNELIENELRKIQWE